MDVDEPNAIRLLENQETSEEDLDSKGIDMTRLPRTILLNELSGNSKSQNNLLTKELMLDCKKLVET